MTSLFYCHKKNSILLLLSVNHVNLYGTQPLLKVLLLESYYGSKKPEKIISISQVHFMISLAIFYFMNHTLCNIPLPQERTHIPMSTQSLICGSLVEYPNIVLSEAKRACIKATAAQSVCDLL